MFVETIRELLERGWYVRVPNDSADLGVEFIQKNLQESFTRCWQSCHSHTDVKHACSYLEEAYFHQHSTPKIYQREKRNLREMTGSAKSQNKSEVICSSSLHSPPAAAEPAPTLQPQLQQKQMAVSTFLRQRPQLLPAHRLPLRHLQ